jgi:hypothetical protein
MAGFGRQAVIALALRNVSKGSRAAGPRANIDRLRRADSTLTELASGRTGVCAKAAIPSRDWLHRPKPRPSPHIEVAFARIANRSLLGQPPLRRPCDRRLLREKDALLQDVIKSQSRWCLNSVPNRVSHLILRVKSPATILVTRRLRSRA